MKVRDIISFLEDIAPVALQESYDNAGLNVGHPDTEITGVLCTLDVTMEVLKEAIGLKANLILTHHPLIFQGIKSLNGKNETEQIIIKAIQNDICIYAGHTNFDNVNNGVNAKICEKLDIIHPTILSPLKEHLYKLATFVPVKNVDEVRTALFEAGAGHIGNYDCCSFNTNGLGSFRGQENSNPFVGEKEQLHFEEEIKLELILPRFLKNKIVAALIDSHPYEEVAYDIFPLANENYYAGAGMIGELKKPIPLNQFLKILKKEFVANGIRYTGNPDKMVKKIAVCGGSGAFLTRQAKAKHADAFVTGDIKYHQFFDSDEKLSIIDIGHYESEQFTKNIFYEAVMKKMPTFAVHLSKVTTTPVKYFK